MNVLGITYYPVRLPAPYAPEAHTRGNLTLGEVKPPANGNPGIVPPWLQGKGITPNVIGIDPVDPNVPHIM